MTQTAYRIVRLLGVLSCLPVLDACYLFYGASASVSDREIPDNLKVTNVAPPPLSDRHPYAPLRLLTAGTWGRFRVTTASGSEEVTIGIVARDDKGARIEVVEEGEPRRVSSRKLRADGRVEAARFQEIGAKTRSAVVPQEILPAEGDVTAPGGERGTQEAELEVLGQKRRVTIERIVILDEALGKATTNETVWCRDVAALYDGSDTGGLVRRNYPGEKLKVELVAAGKDYRPLIPPEN